MENIPLTAEPSKPEGENDKSFEGTVDRKRFASLLALLVTLDEYRPDGPPERSEDEIRSAMLALEKSWAARAFMARNEIVEDFDYTSRRLRKSTFLAPIENAFQMQVDLITALIKPPKKTTFSFDQSAEDYADVSTAGDRRFTITIHLGLIIDVFLGAIALVQRTHGCATSIADPFATKTGESIEAIKSAQTPLLQALNASAFSYFLPKEEGRQLLVYTIATKCLEFAVLHELGHLMRGHLDYGLVKNQTLSETTQEVPESDALTWQLMETQADDYAVLLLSAKWSGFTLTHDFASEPLMCGAFGFSFSSREDLFTALGYSYCLLFFILGNAESSRITQSADAESVHRRLRYPPLSYRLWRALKLGRIPQAAGIPWDRMVENVRNSLVHACFPIKKDLFFNLRTEDQLSSYDELLKNAGQDLLSHEKRWTLTNCNPMPPLPRLSNYWAWNVAPQNPDLSKFWASLVAGQNPDFSKFWASMFAGQNPDIGELYASTLARDPDFGKYLASIVARHPDFGKSLASIAARHPDFGKYWASIVARQNPDQNNSR